MTTPSRKYGTDKPDLRNPIEMQDVSEHFRGCGFKVFAGMLERDAKARVWAIPAPGGGSRAFCDRMNAWAQGEGQPGLGYIFFREGERGRRRSGAPRTSAPERTEAIRDAAGPEGRRRGLLRRRAIRRSSTNSPARRATKIGDELNLVDEGPLRVLLDRRLPVLRVERGREEDRLLAQPVLDAAGRA